MTNYSIVEEFTLPSLGKVYKQNVNPVVKLRSMTTEEEMRRLAPSENAYKNICEIIDDCIVEKPGISCYDMCLADYQFLLHRLRVVTYGPNYNTTSTCPFCRAENESTIDLTELDVTQYDSDDFTKLTEFTLPKTGKRITIKMQTPRMIDDVNARSRELQKKSKNTAGDTAFLFTLQSLIDTVDGHKIDPVKKEDFVRKLPMMDTNYIIKHAQKLVESFGVNTKISKQCSICGLDYDSSFRITSEFFGPSIDI
jgi:hypothetical protein